MSFIFGCLMAAMAFFSWHADTQAKKVVVMLVVMTISLIFGVMAARGFEL